jgi:hypothetical protein
MSGNKKEYSVEEKPSFLWMEAAENNVPCYVL